MINTHFWEDWYVENLDPIQKLLFLYILTCTNTSIAWIYEISYKKIAFQTWIDKDMVEKIINKFSEDDKIFYIEGYIYIKNFLKHQSINPKTKIWIENQIKDLPVKFWQELAKNDSLYIDYIKALGYININININTNINSNVNEKSEDFSDSDSSESEKPNPIIKDDKKTLKQLATQFFTQDFLNWLLSEYEITSLILTEELKLFANYWTEKNEWWTKERWQKEKTFEIRRRFYRWLKNNNKWWKKSDNFTKDNWIVLVPDNF